MEFGEILVLVRMLVLPPPVVERRKMSRTIRCGRVVDIDEEVFIRGGSYRNISCDELASGLGVLEWNEELSSEIQQVLLNCRRSEVVGVDLIFLVSKEHRCRR